MALMVVGLLGCTHVLIPPSDPQGPTQLFLVDHGRHPSLVMPMDHEGKLFVRYAYGDWRWYALGKEGFFSGLAALFWPTQATLGRKVMSGNLTQNNLIQQIREHVEEVIPLVVEATSLDRLRSELEASFLEGEQDKNVYNADYDLYFVPYPRPYSILRNSNTVMAQWLRAIGIEVRGSSPWSIWRPYPKAQ